MTRTTASFTSVVKLDQVFIICVGILDLMVTSSSELMGSTPEWQQPGLQ